MKDWKTTAVGVLGGAFYAMVSCIQSGSVKPKDVAIAAAFGALGYFARDRERGEGK